MASNGDITEVPISYGKRLGKQKLKPVDGTRIISTLVWMANYYNPVVLYGAIVSLAAIPAAGILLYTIYDKLVLNIWHSGYALLGIMLLLLATQAAAVSVMSLLVKRSEHRVIQNIRRLRLQGTV